MVNIEFFVSFSNLPPPPPRFDIPEKPPPLFLVVSQFHIYNKENKFNYGI